MLSNAFNNSLRRQGFVRLWVLGILLLSLGWVAGVLAADQPATPPAAPTTSQAPSMQPSEPHISPGSEPAVPKPAALKEEEARFNAAQAATIDGQNAGDADMWRAVKAGETGYTTAQGIQSDMLINVFGNEGKTVRDQYIMPAMSLAVVGVFGVFLLFYLVNGTAKLHHGFSGRMLSRWSRADIWLHWLMAVSCIVLILTGLVIMLGRYTLEPHIASGVWATLILVSKTLHDYAGPVFFISWALCVLKWMPMQTFKLYDLKWFMLVGGYINFGPFKGKHPDSGFANAGEKMWFWTLVLFGLFVIVTGFMLVLPGLDLPREASMAALLIHDISAIILIAFTIVHIWMATVLSEGGMESMVSGYCDENWAIQHHNLWFDEMKANGSLKYKRD